METKDLDKNIENLISDILEYLPRYFEDFENHEYENGTNAGKDFKKIYNKAKKINKALRLEKTNKKWQMQEKNY